MKEMTVAQIAEAAGGVVLNDNPSARISFVSIDSRNIERGKTLFVPIIGEKTDAHRFLPDVENEEAAAALISETIDFENRYIPGQMGMAVIRVKDTVRALQDIAFRYRRNIGIPLIGITGSVGKTTTREMTALALSAGFQVFKTPSNHNSQIGVPLTLFEIGEKDEIGVIEMGMSNPGEMSRISRLVQPESALITNIGIAHIEQLGSRENIRTEKMHICDAMPEGGTLFLNADDDMLSNFDAGSGYRTVRYGMGLSARKSGNWADEIETGNGCVQFHAHLGKRTVKVLLHVHGKHQILNAMAALCAAEHYGVDPEAAAEKLSGFCGFAHRQQIFCHNGITVIDDTYNASPVSMKAAIDILSEIPSSGRKIAVLADMKELGTETEKLHYEIGTYLAEKNNTDILFTLGELAGHISEGLRESGNSKTEIIEADDLEKLKSKLSDFLRPGDAVLLKGSNSMKLSSLADELSGKEEGADAEKIC